MLSSSKRPQRWDEFISDLWISPLPLIPFLPPQRLTLSWICIFKTFFCIHVSFNRGTLCFACLKPNFIYISFFNLLLTFSISFQQQISGPFILTRMYSNDWGEWTSVYLFIYLSLFSCWVIRLFLILHYGEQCFDQCSCSFSVLTYKSFSKMFCLYSTVKHTLYMKPKTYKCTFLCVCVRIVCREKSSSNNTLIVYSAMIQFNLVYSHTKKIGHLQFTKVIHGPTVHLHTVLGTYLAMKLPGHKIIPIFKLRSLCLCEFIRCV